MSASAPHSSRLHEKQFFSCVAILNESPEPTTSNHSSVVSAECGIISFPVFFVLQRRRRGGKTGVGKKCFNRVIMCPMSGCKHTFFHQRDSENGKLYKSSRWKTDLHGVGKGDMSFLFTEKPAMVCVRGRATKRASGREIFLGKATPTTPTRWCAALYGHNKSHVVHSESLSRCWLRPGVYWTLIFNIKRYFFGKEEETTTKKHVSGRDGCGIFLLFFVLTFHLSHTSNENFSFRNFERRDEDE